MGIGGHIHVEVVTEEITFPMGVPSPITIRLGIMTFAITGGTAIFPAITDPFFSLLGDSADRGPVTGKSQMLRVNKSLRAGNGQELLVIKLEDEKEWIFCFELPAFQQRKKSGCRTERITGSFIAFLFPLWRFHFRETVFR